MILVTGGTGTIGTELVRLLREGRAAFRVLVRNPTKAAALRNSGIDVVIGDLEQPAQWAAPLDGVDALFLLSPVDPRQDALQGAVIAAARQAGVARVVRISGSGVCADSPVRLSRWHAATDARLQDSGLAFTLLRPAFFMQNLLMFASTIGSQGTFSVPAGEAPVAAIDARDVAAVAAAVLTAPVAHENKAYELTGPVSLRFRDMAERLAAATGHPVRYVAATPEAAAVAMRQGGRPEWLVDGMVELYAWFTDGGGARVTGDVHRVLGRPPFPFERFAHDYANAFAAGRKG